MRKTFAPHSMKNVAAWITLMLLAVVPAMAEDRECQSEELFSKLRAGSDVFIDEGAYEVATDLIFYQLPTRLESGKDVLRLEVHQGRRLVLTENISLIDDDPTLHVNMPDRTRSEATVIELLATAPGQRLELRRLADAPDATASLSIRGKVVERLSIAELLARASGLQEGELLPHAIASELHLPELGKPAALDSASADKGACENGCYTQHDFCIDNCVFVPNSGPCFDACDDALDDCLLDCAGQCHPSTSTSTTTTLVSTTILSPFWECLKPSPFSNETNYYRYARLRYKITTTTTTRNADCTVTVTTQVSYTNINCWLYTQLGPCFNPYSGYVIC